MSDSNEGMKYWPVETDQQSVVAPGEFKFAAVCFDHGHIYGQIAGLRKAGGELAMIYDSDAARHEEIEKALPGVRFARSLDEVLADESIQLVAAATIPCDRGPLGCQVMKAGKDYLTDKCPFTSLEQLDEAKRVAEETKRKFMVYYGERVHVESAFYVDQLIQDGAIGDIVHMEIFGPHRLNKPSRPDWFFEKEKYGGILTDIASHQFDQFLHYARCDEGIVAHAVVDNRANADKPEFEDVGMASLILANGVQCFSRVNWFTPDGMRKWGDGRTFITGTKGYIEIRKFFDFTRSNKGELILLADSKGEYEIPVGGKVGFPFFGQLIEDCLNRTENAMTQHHAFQAARLSMEAQMMADALRAGR